MDSVAVSPGNTFAGNQLKRSRTISAPEHREQQDRRLGMTVAQGDQPERQARDRAHARLEAVEPGQHVGDVRGARDADRHQDDGVEQAEADGADDRERPRSSSRRR